MTLNISNQIGEAKLIVETNIAFTSSVFPGQLKHLQNNENIVIRGIYIEIAILDESEAKQRKTDSQPQH